MVHAHAESVAKAWARTHGGGDRVTCSSDVGGLPPHRRTPDFICLVHHGASCDELHVQRVHARWTAQLLRRDAACVQPA
jgi:hypothetical protein